jgi:hypothetical protein
VDHEVDLEHVPCERFAWVIVVRVVEARHGAWHPLALRHQAGDDVYLVRVRRGYQEIGLLDPGLRQKPGTRPVTLDREGVELLCGPLDERLVLLDQNDVVMLSREHHGRVETHLSGSHDNDSHVRNAPVSSNGTGSRKYSPFGTTVCP